MKKRSNYVKPAARTVDLKPAKRLMLSGSNVVMMGIILDQNESYSISATEITDSGFN